MRPLWRPILIGWLCVLVGYWPAQAQPNTPQPIAYGQTVDGELTTTKADALYTFEGKDGDSIAATLEVVQGTFSPLLILMNASQQTVLGVSSQNDAKSARLRFVLPVAGKYILKATAVQGAGEIKGTFKLNLTLTNAAATPVAASSNVPLAAPSSAGPLLTTLKSGQDATGTLDDVSRFRLYVLRARKNETISATLEVPDGADKLQAGMYLFATDFRPIARAELGQALNTKAPEDGIYFLIVARAATTGAGPFKLRPGTAVSASSLTITVGQTVRGRVTNENAVNTYSLVGKQGQAISARMRRLSGDLVTYLYVVTLDDGKTIAQATDNNGVAELSVVLPSNATYAIVATRGGQQAGQTNGEYALTLSQPGQTPQLPPAFQSFASLEFGDKPNGSIDNTIFAVPYVFSALTGDRIQAKMAVTEGNLDPYLVVQNVNGQTLAEGGTGGKGKESVLQMTIPESGLYALIATRANLATGNTSGKYTLSLDTITTVPVGTSVGTLLLYGQPQNSPANSPVGTLYRFEAQPNTTVEVNFTPTGGYEAALILMDSEFTPLATTTGSIRSTALSKPGIYYLLVLRAGGPNQPAVGSYALTLQGTSAPVPTSVPGTVNIGQATTGKISNDVYQMRYPLALQKGTTVVITLDAAPGSTLDPLVGIVDPDGNVLGVNDDASPGLKNASLTLVVPKDGSYTIVATRSQEARGTTAGEFILKVSVRQSSSGVQPIRFGDVITGELTPDQPMVYYTFRGDQGSTITVKLNAVPGAKLDPIVYLYDYSTGQPVLIAANTAVAPVQDAVIPKFKLPRTGTYLIVATRANADKAQDKGSFVLTLNKDE